MSYQQDIKYPSNMSIFPSTFPTKKKLYFPTQKKVGKSPKIIWRSFFRWKYGVGKNIGRGFSQRFWKNVGRCYFSLRFINCRGEATSPFVSSIVERSYFSFINRREKWLCPTLLKKRREKLFLTTFSGKVVFRKTSGKKHREKWCLSRRCFETLGEGKYAHVF